MDSDANLPFQPTSENASSDWGDSVGGIHRSSSSGLMSLNESNRSNSRGLLVAGGVEISTHVSPDFFSTVPRTESTINRTPDTDGRSDVARLFHENTNGFGPGTLLSTMIFVEGSNSGRSTRGREIPMLTVGLRFLIPISVVVLVVMNWLSGSSTVGVYAPTADENERCEPGNSYVP